MPIKQTPTKKKRTTKTPVATAKAVQGVANKKAPEAPTKPHKDKMVPEPRRVTKESLAKASSRPRLLRKPPVVSGFAEFLREQSVVGLAIGLVIGAQVKALADQLIASFINPFIGLILPGTGSLDKKVFIMHLGDKSAKFAWGSFAAVMLSFITTALVIYFVFKALKLDKLAKKKS